MVNTILELLNSLRSALSDSPLHDAAYIFNRRQIWTASSYAYEATLLSLLQNESWHCLAEIDSVTWGKGEVKEGTQLHSEVEKKFNGARQKSL